MREPESAPRPSRTAPTKPARVTPAPVAIPKFVIPTRESAPTRPALPTPPPVDTGSALRERLARRLTAPAAEVRAEGEAAPRIAGIPPPESAAPPRPASVSPPAVATAVPSAGSVQAVGYFPHNWYLNALVTRIEESWSPPSEFYGAGNVAALVSFRIGRDGRISRIELKESSGHARFDLMARAAIQRLAQVPPLPEQYAEESLDVVNRMHNEN